MIRMIVLIAAAGAWVRALAGPIALITAGAFWFCVASRVGAGRSAAFAALILFGLAAGWACYRAVDHARRQRPGPGWADGEGESL